MTGRLSICFGDTFCGEMHELRKQLLKCAQDLDHYCIVRGTNPSEADRLAKIPGVVDVFFACSCVASDWRPVPFFESATMSVDREHHLLIYCDDIAYDECTTYCQRWTGRPGQLIDVRTRPDSFEIVSATMASVLADILLRSSVRNSANDLDHAITPIPAQLERLAVDELLSKSPEWLGRSQTQDHAAPGSGCVSKEVRSNQRLGRNTQRWFWGLVTVTLGIWFSVGVGAFFYLMSRIDDARTGVVEDMEVKLSHHEERFHVNRKRPAIGILTLRVD